MQDGTTGDTTLPPTEGFAPPPAAADSFSTADSVPTERSLVLAGECECAAAGR